MQHAFGKSRTSFELLDVPTSFNDRLYSNVRSGTDVSRMLDDVRFSLYLDPARSPGFHRLQIIDNEGGSRILEHILVLHRVRDVPATHVDVFTVSVEANGGNIGPSGLGRCSDSGQWLRFQIGQFFLGEQSLTTLSERSISGLYSVS